MHPVHFASSVVLLLCLASPGRSEAPPAAAQPDPFADLKQLFKDDPATAFEKAWKLFQEPRKKGDLEGMMRIVRVVAPESIRCRYIGVIERMCDAAGKAASAVGKWLEQGEVDYHRANTCMKSGCVSATDYFLLDLPRIRYLAEEASRCYQKAGVDSPAVQTLLQDIQARAELERNSWFPTGFPPRFAQTSQKHQEALNAAGEAKRTGRDADCLSILVSLMRDALADTTLTTDQVELLTFTCCHFLWLTDGQTLLPLLHALVVRAAGLGADEMFDEYPRCCWQAWRGGNDPFYQELYWCLGQVAVIRRCSNFSDFGNFAGKMRLFGRRNEAVQLVSACADIGRSLPDDPWQRWHTNAATFIFPETPLWLQRGLLDATLASALRKNDPAVFLNAVRAASSRSAVGPRANAERLFLAGWLLDAAFRFPADKGRAQLASEACLLYDKAGRQDLSEQVEQLVAAVTAGDPKAKLECALIVVSNAASQGRWQEVEQKLESVLAEQFTSGNLSIFRAAILLEQAKRALGKPAEAEAYLAKAKALIGQVGLSAGQQVNYLTTFADRTSDKGERAQLLEQAKQAAESAGLTAMAESLATQLSQLALETGNLPSAKKALLDLVKQQEAKRERLAFDPLLRQQ